MSVQHINFFKKLVNHMSCFGSYSHVPWEATMAKFHFTINPWIIIFHIYVFIYFSCSGSLLLHGIFSSCGEWGLLSSCCAQASHHSGFLYRGAWALGCTGLSSCGSWSLEHRLSSCDTWAHLSHTCGTLPDQGLINPVPLHWQSDSQPLDH